MTRGNLYRVQHPSSRDPKRARVFVVVSHQALMESLLHGDLRARLLAL